MLNAPWNSCSAAAALPVPPIRPPDDSDAPPPKSDAPPPAPPLSACSSAPKLAESSATAACSASGGFARSQSLAELLRSKESEWRELETVLAAAVAEETSAAVSAAAAGARRVQGEARSLARELCSTAEAILLARIEERALAAVAQLDGLSSDARRADLAGWTRLAEQATGGAWGNGLAPKLVEIAALSASISEIHATEAAEALAGAESSNADAQAATAQALRSTRSALVSVP